MDDVGKLSAGLSQAQREQVRMLPDGEMTWSATHGWPGLCDDLRAKGLIKITGEAMWGTQPKYRSTITPLGEQVRAHLIAREDSK